MAEKCEQLKKSRKRKPVVSKLEPDSRKKPAAKEKSAQAGGSGRTAKVGPAKARPAAALDVDGETALYKATNSTIAAKAEVIVKKLAEKAEAGNTASAKLLIEIVQQVNRSGKRASKRLQEIISSLEADSSWAGTEVKSGG